jgi:two-component system sensor kinase FixL
LGNRRGRRRLRLAGGGFDEFPWGPNTGLPRDLLYFSAFFCMGLFMHEVTRSRKLSARHMRQIEGEMTARRDAEEQLKVLVDSSPAAIITTSSDGCILLANDAANRLFGLNPARFPACPSAITCRR